MHGAWNRRNLLRGGAAMVALGLAAPSRGQDLLKGLLGDKLVEPLKAILPREAQDAAGILAELVQLEDEAERLQYPESPLTLRDGAIPADPERLYEAAMPRLVALVDRSERSSPAFAERAAELLARLHSTQHGTPEAWFGGRGSKAVSVVLGKKPLRIAEAGPGSDDGAAINLPPIDLPPPEIEPSGAPVEQAPLPPISTSLKYPDLAEEYANWFAAARIRPEHRASADWHLTMMRKARPRYLTVGQRLGIPWHFIAAIHGLEASFNFRAHYHNGDFPLSRRTRQVPANRPPVWQPPSDWESSAADALRLMGFANQKDWSLTRMLHRLEAYNGFGYRRAGRASPYLWSFSSHYTRGKFIADGRYDPRARSQQCGAAVMLKLLETAGELG